MIRVVLLNAVMFMLPLVIWSAWRLINRQLAEKEPQTPFWENAPFGWLALAGAVLSIGALAMLVGLRETSPGVPYHSPLPGTGDVVPAPVTQK